MADQSETIKSSWKQVVAGYQTPDLRRSLWQVANTVIPYFVLWYLMYRSLEVSYWLTLALAIPASGFLVRAFIIFHDCGHGSFFKSKTANHALGFMLGILTFTPYYHWRHDHSLHHASAGDLDRRGKGDVWTMTVSEYQEASGWKRLIYSIYRHPVFMFGFGSWLTFLVFARIPNPSFPARERNSVHWTNLALVVLITLMSFLVGLKAYLLVQLPIILPASVAGVWLFYVQHQFEDVVWERHENWDYVGAALVGSSYYKLPRLLQWFTGNIGVHHIHHLSPRIPNYYLERCQKENPIFQNVKPLTLLKSLRSLNLRVWDEDRRRLVGF
jgi:omega-6 fatty acid desaturase (delta-12 desaturase)